MYTQIVYIRDTVGHKNKLKSSAFESNGVSERGKEKHSNIFIFFSVCIKENAIILGENQ